MSDHRLRQTHGATAPADTPTPHALPERLAPRGIAPMSSMPRGTARRPQGYPDD